MNQNVIISDDKLKDKCEITSDNESEETCKDEDEGHIQIRTQNNESGYNSNARNFIYNDSADCDDTF